jgi:hypothetical protein
MIVERKNSIKQSKIRRFKLTNYTSERVGNFKHLEVTLNEDNYQIHLQERMKNANKKYFMLQNSLKDKNIQKTKIDTKEDNNRQNINMGIRNLDTNQEI